MVKSLYEFANPLLLIIEGFLVLDKLFHMYIYISQKYINETPSQAFLMH